MRNSLLLFSLFAFLCTHAQNNLSFTINLERKLFAKADNHITVGGTEGVLNVKK